MKIKKNGEVINLTESDLKRIVEHSNRLDEGLGRRIASGFAGIGGMFKGGGYNYTKYAYQLSGAINELNEELEETKKELSKIRDKSYKSKMSDESFDLLNDKILSSMGSYDELVNANKEIMDALDKSVNSSRERTRPDNINI